MRRLDLLAIVVGVTRGTALLFGFAALGGCVTVKPVPTTVQPTCADVCAHGAELRREDPTGCKWSTPTPKGAPCSTVCENATAAGIPWKLECLATITTCNTECP